MIGVELKGGLYHPIFLKHYMHQDHMSFDEIQHIFGKLRSWHRAPLASLRQCFNLLGSGRLTIFTKEQHFQLYQLHSLYFYKDDYLSGFMEYLNLASTATETPKQQQVNKEYSSDELRAAKKKRVTEHQEFHSDNE